MRRRCYEARNDHTLAIVLVILIAVLAVPSLVGIGYYVWAWRRTDRAFDAADQAMREAFPDAPKSARPMAMRTLRRRGYTQLAKETVVMPAIDAQNTWIVTGHAMHSSGCVDSFMAAFAVTTFGHQTRWELRRLEIAGEKVYPPAGIE